MPNFSKTVYCVADNRHYGAFNLSWGEKSTDIVNNTSTISWQLTGHQGGITFTGSDRASAVVASAYINGTCVCSKALGLRQSPESWQQTGTITITHNSDGNKTINVTLKLTRGGGNYSGDPWTYESATDQQSMTLTYLPRLSTLSSSTLTAGTAGTLTITRKSTSFTSTVTYKMGSASGTIATRTSSTSLSFTPPLSLASEIPKATSGSIVFTVQTYNGSTLVGSTTKSVTLKLPASIKPTISSLTLTPVSDTVPSSWNVYVAGKSKVKVTLNSPEGSYGSTISSYQIKVGSGTGTVNPFTTDIVQSAGTISVSATVTDSRGRVSDALTSSLTVQDYSPPSISDYSVQRCTADGTPSDEGTCALGLLTFSYSSCDGHNSVTATAKYRVAGSTGDYTSVSDTFTSGTGTVFGSSALSAESTYEIVFDVSDAFNTVSIQELISTAEVVLDFKAGGKGIAFGKVAEKENAFELTSSWDAYFYGKELKALIQEMLEKLWPVGSVFASTVSTNPNSLLGFGTWVAFAPGRVLMGVGKGSDGTNSQTVTALATGGEYKHKLTESEMPAHTHLVYRYYSGDDSVYPTGRGEVLDPNKQYSNSKEIGSTGGSQSHNNIQPYIGVYFWRRTA